MKTLAAVLLILALTGCATVDRVKQLWPRAHDPVLVDRWVDAHMAIEQVDCADNVRSWTLVVRPTEHLAQLAEFRKDPQAVNMRGLADHAKKMSQGGSKMFCELGKKTAAQRLAVAKTAWEGR